MQLCGKALRLSEFNVKNTIQKSTMETETIEDPTETDNAKQITCYALSRNCKLAKYLFRNYV